MKPQIFGTLTPDGDIGGCYCWLHLYGVETIFNALPKSSLPFRNFLYIYYRARRSTLPQGTYLRRLNSQDMADWYRNTRGKKGWFEGKDLFDLLDRDSGITNPMLTSRATYQPSTGVFEIYVNMYDSKPYDPVRSRRSISEALKRHFNVQGLTITDVLPLKVKNGSYRTRVAFYAKTDGRPDAGKVEKVREVIAKAAKEPLFRGVNKSGDTVEYTFTELPYSSSDRSCICKGCYERRAGADRKNYAVKGYYWNVV